MRRLNAPPLLPLLLAAWTACAAASPAAAAQLTAWEIRVSSPAVLSGDFVFAGALEVRGVEMRPEGLFMPAEESGGRTYRDVKLLSRAAYSSLDAAFKKGAGAGGARKERGKLPWTIKGIRQLSGKFRKANMDVDFDGDLLVTAGLMLSDRVGEEYWIAWPRSLVFLDKKLKKAVEKDLLQKAAKEGL
ncbi:MAG TPA: hypothetical protein PKK31_01245 [Elusimicrobiales bacterium]|nr:hypothetical protein [Elusimicrobiales bacterium]